MERDEGEKWNIKHDGKRKNNVREGEEAEAGEKMDNDRELGGEEEVKGGDNGERWRGRRW